MRKHTSQLNNTQNDRKVAVLQTAKKKTTEQAADEKSRLLNNNDVINQLRLQLTTLLQTSLEIEEIVNSFSSAYAGFVWYQRCFFYSRKPRTQHAKW